MIRLFWMACIALGTMLTCFGGWDDEAKKPHVALYLDRGCHEPNVYRWAELLMSSPEIYFMPLTESAIRRGSLDQAKVLVIPVAEDFNLEGGWHLDARAKYAAFLSRGGKCLRLPPGECPTRESVQRDLANLLGVTPSFITYPREKNARRVSLYTSELDVEGNTCDIIYSSVLSARRADGIVQPVSGDDIAHGVLDQTDALVLPEMSSRALPPEARKALDAFVKRGGKVASSVCGALPVDPADAWPSSPTTLVKAELVAYARAHGHAPFVERIASETNTTDWMAETLEYGTKLLQGCEGRDFRDAVRRTALELIDYPLHVDNYHAYHTTSDETNAWERAIYAHLSAARERVLAEFAATRVPEGSLCLWRIYNMAYLVKGPRHTILIDLPGRPRIKGLWTERDFARFADIADMFVLTHPHNDHGCREIFRAFIDRKKPVITPCAIGIDNPHVHMLNKDHFEPIEIGGVLFRNFLGHQCVPCNVYWIEVDGVRIADNGDNSNETKDAMLTKCPPVDVIIGATWNNVTRLVGACADARGFDRSRAIFLPSHENELGHCVEHREGYRRMYAHPARLAAPFQWPRTLPLHWGESVTVESNSRKAE